MKETGAIDNIYSNLPKKLPAELFEKITQGHAFRLERIISKGHATPEGEWYDQEQDEWVILLKGRARLLLAGASEAVELGPGDHLHLPAHLRHRVEWTDPETETIWLALHYD
ncbi:MAG: cupin domain-containing protein [Proteobacteria bacterium]|nr:cupin domain-containing protein [Pseudomonadota bacterium]MBU1715285.1 cupin domain-containing protein [Pseudomonadota bacterium]